MARRNGFDQSHCWRSLRDSVKPWGRRVRREQGVESRGSKGEGGAEDAQEECDESHSGRRLRDSMKPWGRGRGVSKGLSGGG